MRRALLAALACAAAATAAAALDVPYLSGRVNDGAGLLDAGSSAALERTLKAYEGRTGRQIVVLTVPSLQGEALEAYSLKVARTWRLGRKGKDDGVLLLIARDDRKLRLEVGYGLEGALPDARAGRIISDVIVPRFRAGAFAAGIRAGVDAVIAALDGEPTAAPFVGERPRDWKVFFISLFLLASFVYAEVSEVRTTGFDVSLYLSGAVVIPVLFYILLPTADLRPAAIVMIVYLLSFAVGKYLMENTDWGRGLQIKRKGPHKNDAFFFGGSGRAGGGGFSGGGGSFGGGGASGGW